MSDSNQDKNDNPVQADRSESTGKEDREPEARSDDPLADLIAEMPLDSRVNQSPEPDPLDKLMEAGEVAAVSGSPPKARRIQSFDPVPVVENDASSSNLLKALSKAGVVPVGLIPLVPDPVPESKLLQEVRQVQVPAAKPDLTRIEPPDPEPEVVPAPRTRERRRQVPAAPAPVIQPTSCSLICTAEEGPTLFMAEPDRYFGMREGLRGCKNKLAFRKKELGQNVFVFTGPNSGVGVSTVTYNLALVMALDMADHKILIVDANLSKPSLHLVFGCSPEPGLINFLTEPLDLGMILVNSGMPNLHLITCGDSVRQAYSPFDLARMDYLLEEVRSYYDYILIDTAPALRISDTRVLARKSDGVVITIRYNDTKNQVAQELVRQLQDDGTEVIGSVLNRRVFEIPKFFYKFI